MKIPIGLADDHQLFLKSLVLMLDTFQHYEVVVEASNGKDLQNKLQHVKTMPEIMLIDVDMPVMDGIATAGWLQANHPSMKLIALSVNDSDKTIIHMIRAGCCAYLLKDIHPNELEKGLQEVYTKGFYNADASNINYRRLLMSEKEEENLRLSEREKEFLQYACSEMTYKQVAFKMQVSERTVDGYRENLFQKFNVQSRVGLCLEAIRKKLVKI